MTILCFISLLQVAARKAEIDFQKAEKKRVKEEAIIAKREAREAAKAAQIAAAEIRKQNTLEAKRDKALIDAETKELKQAEKTEAKLMKRRPKGGGKDAESDKVIFCSQNLTLCIVCIDPTP